MRTQVDNKELPKDLSKLGEFGEIKMANGRQLKLIGTTVLVWQQACIIHITAFSKINKILQYLGS